LRTGEISKTASMKAKQTSIIDIAKALGVSKSTVSRALLGHTNVNDETRKAVLHMSAQLDYQRNTLALGLARKKTSVVGIIVPELQSNFFPSVISGIEEFLRKNKYRSIICQSGESYEHEVESVAQLLSYQVDGILASHTYETRNFDHFRQVQRKGVPLVMFNRVTDQLNVPKVVVDDYEAAFAMVDFLIQSGRRRIAHLAGPDALINSRLRLKGYLDALEKNGVEPDQRLILSYDLSIEKVKIYVKHFLELESPPDAIFCINDPTALAAMLVIKQKNLRIPEDIALAGFSNDFSSDLVTPTLSTVAQPTSEIGREAARLLLEEMAASSNDSQWQEYPKETMVLKTRLLLREST